MSNWFIIGEVALFPNRYRTVVIDAADLQSVSNFKWHIRAGRELYARAWIDSRRASAMRGKAIYLHELVFPVSSDMETDFVNRNTLDCRRSNLRRADRTDNNCNRRVTHSNTGRLGVHFCKEREKFVAQIKYRGKWKYLGRYDELEEAVAARDRAAIELHGEFAAIGVVNDFLESP